MKSVCYHQRGKCITCAEFMFSHRNQTKTGAGDAWAKEALVRATARRPAALGSGFTMETMKTRRGYTVLLLLAVTSTFNACLGYEEELWVRRDGSGSVHFQIILSQMLAQNLKKTEGDSDFEESLTRKFEKIEGLRVTDAGTYERSGNAIVAVKMDFDSWERMKDVQLGPEEGAQDFPDFLGVVSLSNDEEGRLAGIRPVLSSAWPWLRRFCCSFVECGPGLRRETDDSLRHSGTHLRR